MRGVGSKGNATIFTLFLSLACFAVMAMAGDIGLLYAARIQGNHALNLALRAAAAQVDPEALADAARPHIRILPDEAYRVFLTYLRRNMKLDESNAPLAGSVASGPVTVKYFRVVNEEELPFSYSYGSFQETITKPGVTAIISYPVRLGPFGRVAKPGLSREVEVKMHVTVVPEILPEEV